MREGWLIDSDDRWIWRFWRDENVIVLEIPLCFHITPHCSCHGLGVLPVGSSLALVLLLQQGGREGLVEG